LYRLDVSDGPLVIVYGRANYTALNHRANAILRVGRRKSHHTETLIGQYVTRQRISTAEGYADEFCTDAKSAEHHGTLPTLQEHATASVRNVLPECRNALRTQNNHGSRRFVPTVHSQAILGVRGKECPAWALGKDFASGNAAIPHSKYVDLYTRPLQAPQRCGMTRRVPRPSLFAKGEIGLLRSRKKIRTYPFIQFSSSRSRFSSGLRSYTDIQLPESTLPLPVFI